MLHVHLYKYINEHRWLVKLITSHFNFFFNIIRAFCSHILQSWNIFQFLFSSKHFQLILAKLDGSNYLNWVLQFQPFLRNHYLLGFVDGTEPCPTQFFLILGGRETTKLNPFYFLWTKKEQFILSCLNASLSDKVLSYVYRMTMAHQVWNVLANRYAS